MMGRFSGSNAHGHSARKLSADTWRISWVVDRYYPTSSLRHPIGYSRITDDAGAKRFAKKHGFTLPENEARTAGV